MTYESMLNKSQELERKIQEIQMKIEDFPEGKLICAANGKGYKWYLNTGGKTVYLPKKERTFARQLAHKKYLSFQLKNMIRKRKQSTVILPILTRMHFKKNSHLSLHQDIRNC